MSAQEDICGFDVGTRGKEGEVAEFVDACLQLDLPRIDFRPQDLQAIQIE